MEALPPFYQATFALLAFVIGGGTIGPWLVKRFKLGGRAEMEKELESKFVTLPVFQKLASDVDKIGGKITGVQRVAEIATENAEAALTHAEQLERRQSDQWERITERLSETARVLDRVSTRVEAVALEQARTEGQLRGRRFGDE